MHMRSLVLFLLFLPDDARRSIRTFESYHGAQQQNSILANSLGVSAEAREAFLPGAFGKGIFRRASPQAGALRKGFKQVGQHRGQLEPHRVSPRLRFAPRRANVGLQAGGGAETDELLGKELPRRVALITGANKGIGKEIARQLGSVPNLTALVACRDPVLGESSVAELKAAGCDVEGPIRLDLTDAGSIQAAAEEVRQRYGQLDVLINNAAVCFNDPTLYGKVPHTPFRDQAGITLQTNFFGTLAVTRAFLPLLEKSPSPRIVNVASAAGRLSILKSPELVRAFTSESLTATDLESLMEQFVSDVQDGSHAGKGWPNTCYGVSKVGVIALTRILARDYPRIMVNSVDPGYCRTDQNNNMGMVDPARGARTPALLATLDGDEEDGGQFVSGGHFYQEQEIPWSY